MRLEYHNKSVMRISLCNIQCSRNLTWVMCIVVNYCDSVKLSLDLKSSVHTLKLQKPFSYIFDTYSKFKGNTNSRQGIVYIVVSSYTKLYILICLFFMYKVKCRITQSVVSYICCIAVTVFGSVSYYISFKPMCNFSVVFNLVIYYYTTLRTCIFYKILKRVPDIVQILKEIEVVLFYI